MKCWLLFVLLWGQSAGAAQLLCRNIGGTLFVDYQTTAMFNPEMVQALKSGIALTFALKVNIKTTGGLFGHRETKSWRRVLRYNHLARQYVIDEPHSQHAFPTFESAQSAVLNFSDWPLLPMAHFSRGDHPELSATVNLVRDALPAPLQISTLFDRHWYFHTPVAHCLLWS